MTPIPPGTPQAQANAAPGAVPGTPVGQPAQLPPSQPAGALNAIAGNSAAATFVVRLDKWGEAMQALRALAGPGQPAEAQQMLSFDSIEAMFMAIAPREAGVFNLVLAALDRSRPIVVRLGEQAGDLGNSVAAVTGQSAPRGRHVVALPAANAASLRGAVQGLLAQDCRAEGAAFRCDEFLVQPFEYQQWVLIAFSHQPVPSVQALVSGAGATGVQNWALRADRPLAIHVRPALAARAAVDFQAAKLASLRSVPNMARRGIIELVSMFYYASAHTRAVDEYAFALRASPPSLIGAAQLSQSGLASLSSSAAPSPPETARAISITSSYDLGALARGAGDPFGYATIAAPRDFGRAMDQCGPICAVRIASNPLGFSHIVSRLGAPPEMTQTLSVQRNPALAPGVIDIAVDMNALSQVARNNEMRQFAASVPFLHLHSQVRGSVWSGALGREPNLALEPPSPSAASPAPNVAALACLQRVAGGTVAGIDALGNAAPASREATRQSTLQQLQGNVSCVTDGQMAAEANSYLAALRALPLQ